MRRQHSLAGQWQFQLDPEGTLRPDALRPDRQIAVPLAWQAAFPELQRYSGCGWYQRSFELDESWLDGEVLLRFGAVDYSCTVYVNGERVGAHEGGYTPFTLPIRRYARSGVNTLTVRVYDAVKFEIVIPRWRDMHSNAGQLVAPEEMPHGKQSWYIDVSGIWQDVTLIAVPATYLDSVQVVTDIHSGAARFTVALAGALAASTVTAAVGEKRASASVAAGQPTAELTLSMPDALRWTPETPHLYSASIALSSGDEIGVRFGFREIRVEAGKLLLNDEPIYLRSALDQDFYPETIYTVPSEDYLRDEFQKAKALGLNSLRCHIKPPDPLYLDLADEIGLLIWAEVPSWRTFQPKTQIHPPTLDDALSARVRQTLEELTRRDFNHPSLIVWTIVNEDWGTMLPLSAADRRWLAQMVDFCKRLDPTRLVVDNSPCPAYWGLSNHVKTDLNDFHIYTNIPEHLAQFGEFIDSFSLRPAWLFSQQDDAAPTGDEPLILSEFGNWGLPTLSEMAADGKEPDWFALGPWWSEWGGDPGFPQGVRQRFDQLGLNQIWPDYDSFARATQWHQFAALKAEIETMRRSSSVMGYVITELTDIYWESNGLLDFYRRPKAYFDQFSQINAADVIVAQLPRWAYWDDETLSAALHVSHYSATDWHDLQLRVGLGGGETTRSVPALARGEVREIGDFDGRPARSAQTALQTLKAEVFDTAGQTLAQSQTPILVLPAEYRRAAYADPLYVVDSRAAEMRAPLADDLGRLGYQVSPEQVGRLCVADKVDARLLDWVAQGGDLLCLSSGQNPFVWQQGRGGAYSGDWMTSFSWLRPGVYRRLQVSSPLTLPFAGVTAASVLVGLPMTDPAYQRDFLAGQITGWVGHPALHTVQFRYGRGRVILTTYPLKGALADHPVATAMLHDLIDYLASQDCQPTLTLKA